MRDRIAKGVLPELATAMPGMAAGLTSFGENLEENLGLDILFRLRSPGTPPTDVLVASIDKESADRPTLDDDCGKWPSSLYAHLTETLARS